jgi:hypothetical protein
LTEGGSVAISNRPYACGAAAVSVRKPTPSTKVRLARPTIVQPRWEAHVEATTAVEVLCLLLQHSRPSTGPVTLASGVADIRSHVPFRVRVLNPSMRSQILPMGMVIGLASLQPEQIILIDEPHAVKPPDISFPWPEHQERDMRKDMAPPSTDIDIESHPRDNILTKSWKDDVHLDHLDSTEQKPCWTCWNHITPCGTDILVQSRLRRIASKFSQEPNRFIRNLVGPVIAQGRQKKNKLTRWSHKA